MSNFIQPQYSQQVKNSLVYDDEKCERTFPLLHSFTDTLTPESLNAYIQSLRLPKKAKAKTNAYKIEAKVKKRVTKGADGCLAITFQENCVEIPFTQNEEKQKVILWNKTTFSALDGLAKKIGCAEIFLLELFQKKKYVF